MKRLTIQGVLPGLNEYTSANRTNAYAGAKMKHDTEARILIAVRTQLKGTLTPPVRLVYRWFAPNRRRDKDNIIFAQKFVQDALVKAGKLHDDGWDYIASPIIHHVELDKTSPRVEVEIYEGETE